MPITNANIINHLQVELVDKNIISQKCLDALTSELKYQTKTWNEETTESAGNHSEAELSVFIQHYINHAIEAISTKPEQKATNEAAEDLRKIAAMVLNCYIQKNDMEQINFLIKSFDYNYARLPVGEVLLAIQHCLTEINQAVFRSSKATLSIFLPAIFALCCYSMDESGLCILRNS